MNKIEKILTSKKPLKERALRYASRIKKSLSLEIIEALREKVEKTEDEITSLEDHVVAETLSKDDCQNTVKRLIDLKYKKKLLEAELKAKEEIFNEYFS